MKIGFLVGVCALAAYCSMYASLACLHNSKNLSQNFDNKAWHEVGCNCPCNTISPVDGRCKQCGHRRDAQPLEIITSTKNEPPLVKDPYKDQLAAFKTYAKKLAHKK